MRWGQKPGDFCFLHRNCHEGKHKAASSLSPPFIRSCKLIPYQLLLLSILYVNVGIYLKTDTHVNMGMDSDMERDTDVFLGKKQKPKSADLDSAVFLQILSCPLCPWFPSLENSSFLSIFKL